MECTWTGTVKRTLYITRVINPRLRNFIYARVMRVRWGHSPQTPKLDRGDIILGFLNGIVAIYHFKSQIIKRSEGRSATAMAAYRAREKITDDRTGLLFDYRRIKAASECLILAPDNVPSWVYERTSLWNAVETAEKRKDSQLAREIMVAIPAELSREQQIKLGVNFVRDTYVNRGMVADLAFHDLDSKNPHLHVMLTTRKIDLNGFGKKERGWNPKFRYGAAKGDRLEGERKLWQDYTNQALEEAGISQKVDCRSLKDRGSSLVPQVHLGPNVCAMEKKGIRTARGDEHRHIERVNAEITADFAELGVMERQILDKKRLLKREIERQKRESFRQEIKSSQISETSAEQLVREDALRAEDASYGVEGDIFSAGSVAESQNSIHLPKQSPGDPPQKEPVTSQNRELLAKSFAELKRLSDSNQASSTDKKNSLRQTPAQPVEKSQGSSNTKEKSTAKDRNFKSQYTLANQIFKKAVLIFTKTPKEYLTVIRPGVSGVIGTYFCITHDLNQGIFTISHSERGDILESRKRANSTQRDLKIHGEIFPNDLDKFDNHLDKLSNYLESIKKKVQPPRQQKPQKQKSDELEL